MEENNNIDDFGMISKENFMSEVKDKIIPLILSRKISLLKYKEDYEKRKLSQNKIMIALLIFIPILIALFMSIFNLSIASSIVIIVSTLLIMLALVVFFFKPITDKLLGEFKKDNSFKKEILEILGFSYNERKFLDILNIKRSRLFDFKHYFKDDYILGNFRGLTFEIQECQLSNFKKDDSDSKILLSKSTNNFHGIIVCVTIPRHFTGYTLINQSSILSTAPQNIVESKRFKKITLKSTSLGKSFDIFTSNEKEAELILNPEFVEKLELLKKANSTKSLNMVFSGNKVLVSIPYDKDMFEPIPLSTVNKKADITNEAIKLMSKEEKEEYENSDSTYINTVKITKNIEYIYDESTTIYRILDLITYLRQEA